MIIDFHTHIVPSRIKHARQDYAKADMGFSSVFSDPKARLATAEQLIAAMDRDSVDISIVLNYGWQTFALCQEINDYILESMARFPGRLIGFCTVPLTGDDRSLKEVERCADAGMKGVGEIRPDTQTGRANIETLRPLVEFMIKRGLILLTHASEPVGHQYKGKGSATPSLVYSIICAYPDLKIVCAHWGGGLPFYALMPEVNDSMKNVYFDTAATPFLYVPQIYQQVGQIVGFEKILFGSDYPLLSPRRYLKDLELPAITQGIRRKIMGENARRLLSITSKRT